MTQKSVERTLGELTSSVKALGEQFTGMREEMTTQASGLHKDMKESEKAASVSRANVHRRLDEVTARQASLETEVTTRQTSLENTVATMGAEVSDMKSVTDDVVAMRQQAQGAGTLGHALLRVGGWVLASAGWAVGVYTYWTGRPPP